MDLSVVIPTHRRPAKLRRAIDRLQRQLDPPEFELIVVANAGDDGAPVNMAVGEPTVRTRLCQAAVAGVSAARNLGWQEARSELVLFLGDDILATPTLLREHLSWHRDHPESTVGVLGHVRWADEIKVTPFMRWLEQGLQFDYPSIKGIDAGPGRLYTANVSLKRSMLERVGGFDEELPFLYEDIELGYRLSHHGFRLLYNRRAEGEHLHEITLDSWKERMRFAARGEHALIAKHPELEPKMRQRMQRASLAAPAPARWAKLVSVIPPWVPVLGPRVWRSAKQRWLQALAPCYLGAWSDAERASGEIAPRSLKAE
jgi:GT2 family glycosyltransferase